MYKTFQDITPPSIVHARDSTMPTANADINIECRYINASAPKTAASDIEPTYQNNAIGHPVKVAVNSNIGPNRGMFDPDDSVNKSIPGVEGSILGISGSSVDTEATAPEDSNPPTV